MFLLTGANANVGGELVRVLADAGQRVARGWGCLAG